MNRSSLHAVVLSMWIAGFSTAARADDVVVEKPGASSTTVRFQRKQFSVGRVRGVVQFDGRGTKHPMTDFPKEVALIEIFDRVKFKNEEKFFGWVEKLRGPRTYTYDDVIETTAEGETSRRPLVLLADDERANVEEAWEAWVMENVTAAQEKERKRLAEEAERARATAITDAIQQSAEANRAAANSLAVISGETSLWEVELIPPGGKSGAGFPGGFGAAFVTGAEFSQGGEPSCTTCDNLYVKAYGRNSWIAAQRALRNHPNHTVGAIRKLTSN